MKRLTPLVRASLIDDFIRIAMAKDDKPHGSRLRNIQREIETLFRAYAAGSPNVENLPTRAFGLRRRKALLHAYTSDTQPLKDLKAAIHTEARKTTTRCQYCAGMNREVRTLDHYLEKRPYEHFSVFFRNLVPCCSECNRSRKRTIRGGVRCVIHFYDDPVDQFPILLVAVVAAARRASFSVRAIPVPDPMSELFARHFDSLALEKRLADVSGEELAEMIDGVVDAQMPRAAGALFDRAKAARDLLAEAGSLRNRNGNNYWLAALNEAAAQSPAFLDECEREWRLK